MKRLLAPTMITWPLLFGMFMIMVGNGLQGTLLSLRAELDGFALAAIGVIMSMYYVGYLAGWFVIPKMIQSVGHIRVFAAFASMASTTILIQGVFVDPYIWSIVRLMSGLSFVGLFIVAESWLNNIAPNNQRGQILSIYFLIINAGLFTGQFLINLGSIETMGLFVLISILISLSLLPITLANKPAPGFEEIENLPFKKLVKTSPFAVLCVFSCGIINAGMLAMGPIYGQGLGMSLPQISWLMALFVLGCGTIPIIGGWLSDRMDRRKIIIVICLVGLSFAGWACWNTNIIYLCAFFVGGCSTAIYSIGAAMMNDRLKTSQMTSATATLILINGIGACISPIMLGTLMTTLGLQVFFGTFTVIFILSAIFGTYRSFTGPDISVEQQGDFQAIPPRSTPGFAAMTEPE